MSLLTSRAKNYAARSERPSIYEVLGIADGGPSRRGSTYYKTFQACPREHGLIYDAHVDSANPSEALVVGLLFHYCLQRFYETIQQAQRKSEDLNAGWNEGADKMFAVIELFEGTGVYGPTAATLRQLIEGYLQRYEREDRWRIIAVEETLEYLVAPEYTTRLDLVIEDLDRDGMWLVEHKTAGRITDDLVDNYQMDSQVLGQIWLAHRCVDLTKYPPFRGTLVNIACKDTNRRPSEYTRVEVCPSDRHLAAFEHTVQTRPEFVQLSRKLGYPRWLGNCSGYARGYSRCVFYNLCHDYPQHGVEYWKRSAVELPEGYIRRERS